MIEKIHHIGLAVRSLEEALRAYQSGLGLAICGTEVIESQGVRVAFLPVGETHLELLEPISENSPIAKFLTNRGEGIHHICLAVPDIETALAELKQHGIRLIDDKPRTGAGGARVAFVHPASMHGVLIELHEEPKCPSTEG
jgi:methylmalonyl-CoA epimerase